MADEKPKEKEEKLCVICGDVCPRTKTGRIRQNAKYCCEECRIEGMRRHSNEWTRNAYREDEEWRERRKAKTAQWYKDNIDYARQRNRENYARRCEAKA